VNAAEYGFPQRRIRVFIVASKKNLSIKGSPDQIIQKSGILAQALPIEKFHQKVFEFDLENDPSLISSKFNKSGDKSPFLNSGYYKDGVVFTVKTNAKISKKSLNLGDVLLPVSEISEEYWVEEKRIKEWEYLKGAKSIDRTHKGSGVTYKYAEGKMAFPDLLSNPSRTILTGEGGNTPSRFKHIIRTRKGYRRLTPVELERLNGFPDNWTETDRHGNVISAARRGFFMGNALVVGLVTCVGKVLATEMRRM
jgi:DNA (cytosine-5)-methyltransferase 1